MPLKGILSKRKSLLPEYPFLFSANADALFFGIHLAKSQILARIVYPCVSRSARTGRAMAEKISGNGKQIPSCLPGCADRIIIIICYLVTLDLPLRWQLRFSDIPP